MARNLTSTVKTNLASSAIRPFFMFSTETTGSTLYYWTGLTDISWNSQTWLANSYFKSVGQVSESIENQSLGMSVELTGEPSALISTILNSLTNGLEGNFYFGLLDSSDAIMADPYLLFSGKLDRVELRDGLQEGTIRLTYQSKLIELDKALGFRYNQETQQIDYSSDIGFEYIEAMEDWSGYWGNSKATPNNKKKGKKKKNKKKKKANR